MGQKAHSVGLRLGVTKKWKSTWFTNFSHYSDFLHKNLNLKKFFKGILALNPKKSILVDFKIIKHFSNKIFIFVFFYKVKELEKKNQRKNEQKNENISSQVLDSTELEKKTFIQISKKKSISFQNIKTNKNFLNSSILYRLYSLKKNYNLKKKKKIIKNLVRLKVPKVNLKFILNTKKLKIKEISKKNLLNYKIGKNFKRNPLNVLKLKKLHLTKYYNNWIKKEKKKKLIFYKIRGSIDLNSYQKTKIFFKSYNKNLLNLSKNFITFTNKNNSIHKAILKKWYGSKYWSNYLSFELEKKNFKSFINSFFFDLLEEMSYSYKNFEKLLFTKKKNFLSILMKTFFLYNLNKMNSLQFNSLSNRNKSLSGNLNSSKFSLIDLILQMRLNFYGKYFMIWHYNKNLFIKNYYNLNEHFSSKKNFFYKKKEKESLSNLNNNENLKVILNERNNLLKIKTKLKNYLNSSENNLKKEVYKYLYLNTCKKLQTKNLLLKKNTNSGWISNTNQSTILLNKEKSIKKKKDFRLAVQKNFYNNLPGLKLNIYKLTKLYSNIYFINVNSLHSFTLQNFDAFKEKDDLLRETRKKLQALKYVKKGLFQRWRSVKDYLPNVVNIAKISIFMKNSQFLSDFISDQISILPKKYRQTFFFKFVGKILSNIKSDHPEMLGFRLKFTGRFNKWTRSKKWVYSVGSLTFQSYQSYVSYACSHGLVKKGRFSTKLWYQYRDTFVDTLSGYIIDYFHYSKIKQKQC